MKLINELMRKLGYIPMKMYAELDDSIESVSTERDIYFHRLISMRYTNLINLESTHVLKPTCNKMYKALRNGKESFRKLSTYAKMSEEEKEWFINYAFDIISNCEITMTGFNNKIIKTKSFSQTFTPVEEVVWKISHYIDIFKDRKYVKEVFDKWEEPLVVQLNLKNGHLVGDCDFFALTKYYLIYPILEKYYPEHLWRLNLCLCKFYGHKVERHLNLLFAKEVKNSLYDWVFIETTLWQDKNNKFWHNPARLQNNYEVEYMFNHEKVWEGL